QVAPAAVVIGAHAERRLHGWRSTARRSPAAGRQPARRAGTFGGRGVTSGATVGSGGAPDATGIWDVKRVRREGKGRSAMATSSAAEAKRTPEFTVSDVLGVVKPAVSSPRNRRAGSRHGQPNRLFHALVVVVRHLHRNRMVASVKIDRRVVGQRRIAVGRQ